MNLKFIPPKLTLGCIWWLNKSSKINNSGILILSAERTIPMCVLKIGTTAKGFRHRFMNLTNQNENSQLYGYGLSIKLYRLDNS